jgi:bifunctional pyridoxal-dependent enzyme with beta-cystathionase and maltose regulon repressor activities
LFDFDSPVERAGTWSTRWDRYAGRDVIPLWVADSDFRAPPAVIEALSARAAHGVFGYTTPPPALAERIAERIQRRHAWTVDPAWIVYLPGVVTGLHLAARTLVSPQGHVLVPRPVYQHLKRAPQLAGRRFTEVPLQLQAGRWVFEPADLRREAEALFLCNPQNPGGTVFRRRELRLRRDPLRSCPRRRRLAPADRKPVAGGLQAHGDPDVGEQDVQLSRRRLRLGDHRGRDPAAHIRRGARRARAAFAFGVRL